MKQTFLFATATMLLASCFFYSESGSGNIITQKRNTAAFTAVEASASVEVELKMGTPSIEVEADDNIIGLVETFVEGNTLYATLKKGSSINNAHIKISISMPEVTRLEANSSASIKTTGVLTSNGKISFIASSSADIDADVEAPDVSAAASSSGTVSLKGKTRNYTAKASSSGDINSFDLLSENTNVSASSSGSAAVYASVSLDAEASSSGDIDYKGGATVKSNTNSSGSVTKRE